MTAARHLLLAHDFPPMGGGIARCLGEIARHYPGGGIVVSTGSPPDGGLDRDPAVRVERSSGSLRSMRGVLGWTRAVDRLVHEVRPSFVWAGNLKPAGYPANLLHQRRGLPYGICVYGLDVLTLERQVVRSRLKRAIARRLAHDAALVVAISEWTAARWHQLLGALGLAHAAARTRVVPLGADPVRFRPLRADEELRHRLGLPPARWLLTVSRLLPHKGIDQGIRVLARLAPRHPTLRYAVAGCGEDRPRLERLARSEGVAERVHFLGGVPDADLPALHNLAELYLGLSRFTGDQVEGFGLSLVEASACGRPVVAGRSGGVPSAVRPGETGLLVDPLDADAAAEAVEAVLTQPELAERLGGGGRMAVERYFNWSRVAGEFYALAEVSASSARAGR